ncbi:MAG TPA: serine--tRNA ligase, partial [Erysipelotrichaceae bacterium]|nr:serine--tRNA ligase [Erysipelotrichaceae bacterium]
MLDIKLIRENTQEIIRRLETRGGDFQFINDIVDLDEQRRSILSDVESKKNFRNDASKQIGVLKREGKDTTDLMSQVSLINDQIKELDIKVNE